MAEAKPPLTIRTKMKMLGISSSLEYPMNGDKIGKAFILNNVASTHPGSKADVEELKKTYEMMGFDVVTHADCSTTDMRYIKRKILTNETHKDSNCVVVTIICHGDRRGILLDKNMDRGWGLEDFLSDLSAVESLLDKPKVLIVQACRGNLVSDGRSSRYLADPDDLADCIVVADKADMFVGFASSPNYKADAGNEAGSDFLQAFAKILRYHYKEHPLDRIYLMLKQYMAKTMEGTQCPEERSSLKYLLRFPAYKRITKAVPESCAIQEHSQQPDGACAPIPSSRPSVFKTFQDIEFEHVSTHETSLVYWGKTRLTVMPSTGDVIVWGKATQNDPPKLHVYDASGPVLKRKMIHTLCEHSGHSFLLPVQICGKEYVSVSCPECKRIKLYNSATWQLSTAFRNEPAPNFLFQADTKNIYTVCNDGNTLSMLLIDVSSPKFKSKDCFCATVGVCHSACFIQTMNLVVVSDRHKPMMIRAVHGDSGKVAWEMAGRVDGAKIDPHGIIYSPRTDTLLVADGRNCRVLMVNVSDGSATKSINFSEEMGVVCELFLYKNYCLVHHYVNNRHKVSFFR